MSDVPLIHAGVLGRLSNEFREKEESPLLFLQIDVVSFKPIQQRICKSKLGISAMALRIGLENDLAWSGSGSSSNLKVEVQYIGHDLSSGAWRMF